MKTLLFNSARRMLILLSLMLSVSLSLSAQTISSESSYGGVTYEFEIIGNYLFAGRGTSIIVFDISDENFTQVNSVYGGVNDKIIDLHIDGNNLFILGNNGDIKAYDVSDPLNFALLYEGQLPSSANLYYDANCLDTYNDQLFVATSAGLYKTALSASLNFQQLISESVRSISIKNNRAYGITIVNSNYYLKSWDLSATTLQTTFSANVDNYCTAINDSYLFTYAKGDGGVQIYQIGEDGSLSLQSEIGVGSIEYNYIHYNTETQMLYGAMEESYNNYYFEGYNLADPASPSQTFQVSKSNCLCLKSHDGYLYYSFFSNEGWINKAPLGNTGPGDSVWDKSPYYVKHTLQLDDNLFIGTSMYLYQYGLNNNVTPQLKNAIHWSDLPWGSKINGLAGTNTRLYGLSTLEVVYICDITDGVLEEKGSLNVSSAEENYIYGTENVLVSIELGQNSYLRFFDCSDPSSPTEVLTVNKKAGWDWVATPDEKYFIVSDNYNNEIVIYDISTPSAIQQVSNFRYSKSWAELDATNEYLATALYDAWSTTTTVGIYDISDASSPSLVASKEINGVISDLRLNNDYLFCQMGENGLTILDYVYEEAQKTSSNIEKEETEEADSNTLKSATIDSKELALIIEGLTYGGSKEAAISASWDSYDSYYLAIKANKNHDSDNIYEGGHNIEISGLPRKPEVKEEVTLTMKIEPAEAASNGCSVSPAVGTHEYAEGSDVQLTATDNPQDGWVFAAWEGVPGGSSKATNITMDANTAATAKFEQVELIVVGTNNSDKTCLCELQGKKEYLTESLALTAKSDDWSLTGINVKPINTCFHEVNDSLIVKAYCGEEGTEGHFNSDNQEITIKFDTAIPISQNATITVLILYAFPESFEEFAQGENLKFEVEFTPTATPLTYPSGIITGKGKTNMLLGDIFIGYDKAYPTISKALEYTDNSSDVKLCPKIFNEYININEVKSFSSFKYNEKATIALYGSNMNINCDMSFENLIFDIKNDAFTVNNNPELEFKNSDFKIADTPSHILELNNNATFEKCTFTEENGSTENALINISGENHWLKIESCVWNNTGKAISANESSNVEINESSFNNCTEPVTSQNSDSINIANNTTFTNCSLALSMSKINNFEVKQSNFNNCTNPISSYYCNNVNIFLSNSFKDCTNSITTHFCDNVNIISYNSFKGCSSVFSGLNDKNVMIYKSSFNDCTDPLKLVSTNNVEIISNTFSNGETGLETENCDIVSIQNNTTTGFSNHFKFDNIDKIEMSKNQGYGDNSSTYMTISGSDNAFVFSNKYDGYRGAILLNTSNIGFMNNEFTFKGTENANSTGVYIENCKDINLFANKLSGFATNKKIIDSKNVKIDGCIVNNAANINTGLHVLNSDVSIEKSTFNDNNGNAVAIGGNSNVTVSSSNFQGNQAVISNNSDQTVYAANNYYGSASGPADSDFEGDIDIQGWVEEPHKLIVSFVYDTIYLPIDTIGVIDLVANNFGDPNDSILFTISDELGWLTVPDSLGTTVDSVGVVNQIPYQTPASLDSGGISKATANASSQTSLSVASDSVFLALYHPKAEEIKIQQASQSLYVNDSLRLTAVIYDQKGNEMAREITWTATSGDFSSTNYFQTAETGLISIIASFSDISDELKINVTDEEPIVSSIVLSPDSVNLVKGETQYFEAIITDQFGYPVPEILSWEADGGEVVSGFYFSPESNGTYLITALHDSTGVSGTAKVIVTDYPTGAGETISADGSLEDLLLVYPNPADDVLHVDLKTTLSLTQNTELFMVNTLGQVVLRKTLKNSLEQKFTIKVDQLKPGLYILSAINGESRAVRRVLVK